MGEWGIALFTSSLLPPPPPLLQSLRTSNLLHSPRAQFIDMRQAFGGEKQDGQGEGCECRYEPGTFCFHAEGSRQG
jgi:hypothetical protein